MSDERDRESAVSDERVETCEFARYNRNGGVLTECDRTDFEIVMMSHDDQVRLCPEHRSWGAGDGATVTYDRSAGGLNNAAEREERYRSIVRLVDLFIHPDDRPAMQEALRTDGNYDFFREIVR